MGALVIGGGIGLYAAKVVKMTQMPELVALMHSLVGLAACLVGFASYVDTSIQLQGAEKIIHEVEIYVGILIGAVTFSGSLVAFGKLNGKIGGKPLLLPGRHWLNLLALLVVIWFGREFLRAETIEQGMVPLMVMTAIALLFGIHMVSWPLAVPTCRWWCPCSTATRAGRRRPRASCSAMTCSS